MGAVVWGAKVSRAFVAKVEAIAADHGSNPDFLMACMAFESAETFRPDVRNPISGATGLIQFMSFTAPKLGTTIGKLAAMTAEAQLDYVAAYFAPYRGRLRSLEDWYMAILWPAGIGKPLDYRLFEKGDPKTGLAYTQNHGFDADEKGFITKADAAKRVRAMLLKGEMFRGEGKSDSLDEDVRANADANIRRARVAQAQQLLLARGYHQVGLVDGIAGDNTIDAIIAFRRAVKLPLSVEIDDELLAALADPANQKPIAPERAATTAQDLRERGSGTIGISDGLKKTAGWLIGGAGAAGIAGQGESVADQLNTGTQFFRSVRDLLAVVGLTPSAVVWIVLAGGLVWFLGQRLERHRVNAARTGEHL